MIALADGAAYTLRDDPDEAEPALETASRTGRLALAEMRRLLGVLREDSEDQAPQREPQPGVREIDGLIEQVRAAGLPVSYRVSPDARALPEGIQLTRTGSCRRRSRTRSSTPGLSATAEVELMATGSDVRLSVADTGAADRPVERQRRRRSTRDARARGRVQRKRRGGPAPGGRLEGGRPVAAARE